MTDWLIDWLFEAAEGRYSTQGQLSSVWSAQWDSVSLQVQLTYSKSRARGYGQTWKLKIAICSWKLLHSSPLFTKSLCEAINTAL